MSTMIIENGDSFWINEAGQLHREDGPAAIFASGDEEWYLNDLHHRLDGPAKIWASGPLQWFSRGVEHRLDGPAVIEADGSEEWWFDGNEVTENIITEMIQWMADMSINPDHAKWTVEEKMWCKLKFHN